MALVADIRKTVTDTTPVFAAVGLTDLAVEKVRDARVRAASVRVELEPAKLQTKAQESYESVAARGERLVKRVRTQKSTKDLISQAEATLALGKGAVTTVRKSASEIQRSAKATLTTGRREAVATAGTVAGSIVDESASTAAEVKKSAVRTRTAAKRTATTTKKSTSASKTATKRATTGAKNTAGATKKASTAAADKVGD
jgi:heparin binding hemagglutinin HbhA